MIRQPYTFKFWLVKNWIWVFSFVFGLIVFLPFLAPFFMKIGWEFPAKVIYGIYSFLCHQLPQRSFFLFGNKAMYSLPEIQGAWQDTINPMILRRFNGTPELGWKVAWSDRMVYMYTSILFLSWIWYPLRKKFRSLPLWVFALFLLPMAIDGGSHFISDFAGIGQGFRDTNAWLAILTDFRFSPSFYSGDAFGSFNSLMRLITGILFGISVVGFALPVIDEISAEMVSKYERLNQELDSLTIDKKNK